MAIIVLPDAQEDLLWLQAYMLDKWSEDEWVQAENEIFDKLALVDSGLLSDYEDLNREDILAVLSYAA